MCTKKLLEIISALMRGGTVVSVEAFLNDV